MGSRLKFWCVILLLPVIIAIGHDAYHSYYSTKEKQQKVQNLQIDPKAYQVSDFGYILVTYVPELYESARRSVGEPQWKEWVDPVLRQYTVVILMIPNILLWLYLLVARMLSLPPFRFVEEQHEKQSRDPLDKRKNTGGMKYKRR